MEVLAKSVETTAKQTRILAVDDNEDNLLLLSEAEDEACVGALGFEVGLSLAGSAGGWRALHQALQVLA